MGTGREQPRYPAVRNVVLAAGYDFVTFDTTFDGPALRRIERLFAQKEYERYPLRFHYWSFGTGVVAESVVIDKAYPPDRAGDPRRLEPGRFWQWVERRFLSLGDKDYAVPRPGHLATLRRRSERAENGEARAMSIHDIYCHLHSFYEEGIAADEQQPTSYDTILEVSMMSHVSADSVLLANSEDVRGEELTRGTRGKDGRVEDFTAIPADYWRRIGEMFEPSRGAIYLWGAGAREGDFHRRLIRQTLGSPAYLKQSGYTRISTYRSTLDSTRKIDDAAPVLVTDSELRSELRDRGVSPESLTFGQVKGLTGEPLRTTYACAAAVALGVPVQSALPGTAAVIEAGELTIPKGDEDIVGFYQAHFAIETDAVTHRYRVCRSERLGA